MLPLSETSELRDGMLGESVDAARGLSGFGEEETFIGDEEGNTCAGAMW